MTGNKNRSSGSRKLQSLQVASTDIGTDNMYPGDRVVSESERSFDDFFAVELP